ncbi:MAG: TRAP transporter large permease subunit [Candidatus Accumulibacter sp.]|jgi:TRAP-type mannitol/chloroaromatic compound transport system permease large subunit|nr:TRAP transporter large permease subunit [Accumulibacter sp.]
MTEFLTANMAPIIFASMILFLLAGYPVAFSLAANGIVFGLLGIYLGMIGPQIFQAVPDRIFGTMANDILLAVPFFTFMGLILERSGMAEDLLDTIGQLFGPVRGGLAYAVIFVGALLAATTGIIAASVISMGLISLPIMLRYGYNPKVATGTISASGTLSQIIPPSLVLIVMADQLGKSVGDMYRGAFLPAGMLVALYGVYIFVITVVKPKWLPALPPEARAFREPDGKTGIVSLLFLTVASVVAACTVCKNIGDLPLEETVILGTMSGITFAFIMSIVNRVFKLGLLSAMAEKVTFVLIPPLALIFIVLGTIYIGIATPTEGGAMGATGALVIALLRKRLNLKLLQQAMEKTASLTTFVMFILIGARFFSLTFYAVDGHIWVENLLSAVPGGRVGFLIVINIVIFLLACFLDYFEVIFIIVPLIGPVAEKMGIDLVWFGVLLAVNMQTSFLTLPLGMALFFLRSVAPASVKTGDIYWGSVPFILIQVLAIGLIIAFPQIVTAGLEKTVKVDIDTVRIEVDVDYDSAYSP